MKFKAKLNDRKYPMHMFKRVDDTGYKMIEVVLDNRCVGELVDICHDVGLDKDGSNFRNFRVVFYEYGRDGVGMFYQFTCDYDGKDPELDRINEWEATVDIYRKKYMDLYNRIYNDLLSDTKTKTLIYGKLLGLDWNIEEPKKED